MDNSVSRDFVFLPYKNRRSVTLPPSGREGNRPALKVLTYSYLKSKGDIKKFIQDLRETDYQIDTSWEKLEVEKDGSMDL